MDEHPLTRYQEEIWAAEARTPGGARFVIAMYQRLTDSDFLPAEPPRAVGGGDRTDDVETLFDWQTAAPPDPVAVRAGRGDGRRERTCRGLSRAGGRVGAAPHEQGVRSGDRATYGRGRTALAATVPGAHRPRRLAAGDVRGAGRGGDVRGRHPA